ncbi:MAG: tetratricopeptide repeat protein, partial [bacterium]|nr:tetratricopeptide repeat protein [bacterium]
YTFKELCLDMAGKERFHPQKEMDFDRFNRLFTSYPNYQSYDAALVWEEIRAIIKGAVPRLNLPVLQKALRQFKKGTVTPALLNQLQQQFILFSQLESFQRVDKFVHKYLKIDLRTFAADINKYIQPGSGSEREKENVAAILAKTLDMLTKQQEETGRKYLSFPEYEMLGKKKAPNFKFNRGDIYRIFEWYRDKMESSENGPLWDELDMMPETVDEKHTYDILVCDEVQDLTDTQLDLLFNFVKNPRNMFLAGDTRQTVNPSGFRWEEVRKHFYARGLEVPELKNLSLNFRSSGSIIELSNILLELKEKFTGGKSVGPREEWKYKGRPVTVVSGIDDREMLELLPEAGAGRTVLVRSEAEKETLREQLQTELVFTISEAKGLEFDTVVLWKFCGDPSSQSADVWNATLDISGRNIHEARARHEISLLYVGITRCQKDLIVYDGLKPSVIWETDLLKDNVYITDDRRYLGKVWNVVSLPEEWVEQGHYFFEREHFKAAAECYRNGGDSRGLAKAEAHYYLRTGNYREAGENFQRIGETEAAALNYEKAGAYAEALELWRELDRPLPLSRCRAALLKEEGKYAQAGHCYMENGDYQDAVRCFVRAKRHKAAAEIYLNHLHDIEKAAVHYEYLRDYSTAAGLYTRLDMDDKAAELYFRAKNYPKAQVLWEKTRNTANLLELYRRTGEHEKVLAIYEEDDEMEKAVRYLKGQRIAEPRLREEGGELFRDQCYYQALIRFLVAWETGSEKGLAGKIARCYFELGRYKDAVSYYEQAGDIYTAAQVYEKTGDYHNAFRAYFATEKDNAEGFARSRELLASVTAPGFLREIALGYYYAEDYQRAFFLFRHLGGFEALEGFCHADEGLKDKVFQAWERCRTHAEFVIIAEGCLEKDLVYLGAEFFLTLPFRDNPEWLPRFSVNRKYDIRKDILDELAFSFNLEETCINDLMKTYFLEQPRDSDKVKNMPAEVKENRKRSMSIWGHFLMEENKIYGNLPMVINYLEKSGEYNSLVLHFQFFLRLDSERFKELADGFIKNRPTEVALDESLVFRDHLLGELGALTGERAGDMNTRLARMPVRANNYLLFLSDVVNEENYSKALTFCVKNGLKQEAVDYIDFLAAKGSDGEEDV